MKTKSLTCLAIGAAALWYFTQKSGGALHGLSGPRHVGRHPHPAAVIQPGLVNGALVDLVTGAPLAGAMSIFRNALGQPADPVTGQLFRWDPTSFQWAYLN